MIWVTKVFVQQSATNKGYIYSWGLILPEITAELYPKLSEVAAEILKDLVLRYFP
jgi:hypothetical protein